VGVSAIPAPRTAGRREVAAVILLLFGGVVVTFLGWLAGVVLLWLSPPWRVREKVLGTLVLPGGLAPAIFMATGRSTFFAFDSPRPSPACPRPLTHWSTCATTTLQNSTAHPLEHALVLVVLFAAPLASAVFLLRQLRK
jgi:hypothetical protein